MSKPPRNHRPERVVALSADEVELATAMLYEERGDHENVARRLAYEADCRHPLPVIHAATDVLKDDPEAAFNS